MKSFQQQYLEQLLKKPKCKICNKEMICKLIIPDMNDMRFNYWICDWCYNWRNN